VRALSAPSYPQGQPTGNPGNTTPFADPREFSHKHFGGRSDLLSGQAGQSCPQPSSGVAVVYGVRQYPRRAREMTGNGGVLAPRLQANLYGLGWAPSGANVEAELERTLRCPA
jgi:hypothetical protein